jgi:hypothetical protein
VSDHDISPTWPGWLERARLLHWSEASAFTFVRGAGLDQVRAAFGVEPDARVTPDEMAVGVKAVAIVPCGDGWLVLEDGFQGARPEVLRLASSSGTAASMYWNVNMTNSLSLARDGAMVAFVDAMFPEDVIGDPPEDMRPWLQRLAAEPEALKPIGVMAAAALAGLPLLDLPDHDELEWLPVIPQLEDLHLEQVEYTSLRYDADELVRRVGAEPPAKQHSLARETARALLTEVQLQAVSDVAALLEQLEISGPTPFDPAMRLLLDAHRECEVLARGYVSWTGAPPPPALVEAWARKRALTALRYACEPDAESAALGALTCLATSDRDGWQRRASSLLDDLGSGR